MLSDVNTDSLTAEQKNALREFNLIKLISSRKFKGRMCANGAPYCKFVPREEAKSYTITLKGLLATMVIDAYEGRKVETIDLPGDYLHIDISKDKFVLILLEGKFVDIMCDINP